MRIYAATGERLYINADERARFLAVADAAGGPVQTLCLTLAYTGCRLSEALALTPAAIQLGPGVIAIRCLKKRDKVVIREVPVPPVLLALLDRVHGVHHAQRAGPIAATAPLWPYHRATAWRIVKTVMERAAISGPQATAKGLRHGFGVHAIRYGVQLNMLQKWMGHASMSTTAIYANATGHEERLIAERMWQER
ncbi:integrase [Rhodobium orientis]|uniref:Integrase n=2 Tax=Rhodobium orientis TaxID=34017 RepID=A0A327JHR8_9HYPH|nr:tyrosine-type recombinase/integrase [Rhodobium orientis]MBB4305518.1 integrase [Rhodobium orientis]MBK5949115.1 integrase [Rhodobium orientis]RAI23861.1 integrase [Rhodobium orientis]